MNDALDPSDLSPNNTIQQEAMTRLSTKFRSIKNPHPLPAKASADLIKNPSADEAAAAAADSSSSASSERRRDTGSSAAQRRSMWSVYLIISSRLPKTYVGVTTNFSRRRRRPGAHHQSQEEEEITLPLVESTSFLLSHSLKQHNGELKGGAKASSAGRPWVLACLVRGLKDRSEACEFESKWKNISRKMPRKKKKEEDSSKSLLQHREAALCKVKASFDCSRIQIEWQSHFS